MIQMVGWRSGHDLLPWENDQGNSGALSRHNPFMLMLEPRTRATGIVYRYYHSVGRQLRVVLGNSSMTSVRNNWFRTFFLPCLKGAGCVKVVERG